MGQNQAAKTYDVPRTTLKDRLSGVSAKPGLWTGLDRTMDWTGLDCGTGCL